MNLQVHCVKQLSNSHKFFKTHLVYEYHLPSTIIIASLLTAGLFLAGCEKDTVGVANMDTPARPELANRTIAPAADRIDVLLTSAASDARDADLALLQDGTKPKYEVDNVRDFIYDLEYFANQDSWNYTGLDRHELFFEEYSYPLADGVVFNKTTLDAFRADVSADIVQNMANIGLPSSHKWLDVINISASSDSSIIHALVGVGVNFDPCPGPFCDDEMAQYLLEYYHTDQISGGAASTCDLPDQEDFNYSTWQQGCRPLGEIGGLDYARNFSNRAGYINGVWSPILCNPVDPEIFASGPNIPRSNIITHGALDNHAEASGLVYNQNLCHAKHGIVSVDPFRTACLSETSLCMSRDEAYEVMQGGIAFAVAMVTNGTYDNPNATEPLGADYVCTTEYSLIELGVDDYFQGIHFTLWTR